MESIGGLFPEFFLDLSSLLMAKEDDLESGIITNAFFHLLFVTNLALQSNTVQFAILDQSTSLGPSCG